MKTRVFLILTALALSACGGGEAKNDAPSACNTLAAKAGETVTCSASGFEEGCTLFVGNTPVDAFLTEDGKVAFEVPQVPAGFLDIVYGCGGDAPVTVQKNFQTLPYFNEEGGGGEGEGGEVIVPESEPLPEEPEEEEEPAKPGKDWAVGGEMSAGPGGGGGAAVSLEGTEDRHGTMLNLIRVRWKFAASGDVQEAYIHAKFNRGRLDGTHEDPCGKINGRYLAVNDDGIKFNDGSADAEAAVPYLTGKECHNNNDCAGLSEGGKTPAADVGLKADTGDDAGPVGTPVCRIDLKGFLEDGAGEGEFHTLSLEKELRMVLVAKLANGNIVKDERSWKAPRPVFRQPPSVTAIPDQRRVRVQADYEFAGSGPVLQGCADRQDVTNVRTPDGQGIYEATCALPEGTSYLNVFLRGVGDDNTAKRRFRIRTDAGHMDVRSGDYSDSGLPVGITGTFERNVVIEKETAGGWAKVDEAPALWTLDKMTITPVDINGNLCAGAERLEASAPDIDIVNGKATLNGTFPRNLNCWRYRFEITKTDGGRYGATKELPYGDAVFTIQGRSDYKIDLTYKNLASLKYNCSGYKGDDHSWGGGGTVTIANAYSQKTQEFSVPVPVDDPDQVSCEFEAVTSKGSRITRSLQWD